MQTGGDQHMRVGFRLHVIVRAVLFHIAVVHLILRIPPLFKLTGRQRNGFIEHGRHHIDKRHLSNNTMEAFREQVRKQLHDGKHASALNRAKDQVLTQLASAAEGELPSVLVESTYQQEMQNIQQQLQMQRMSLDRYLSQIHQTRENFTANVHAAAEKNTRARMALLQVAQNEGLVPTDEEITKNLQERADRTKKTLEEVKANANIPAMQRSEAIRRAADWVIEHSTIEEK